MNYENLVLGSLSNDAFVMVNKKMARKLGFTEAGLLGELIATYNMVKQGINGYTFYKNGAEGAWFYLTQPTVEERLGIKRREHDTAIKNLVKENVIEKKQKGLPAKSYYLLNWKIIAEKMSENEPQSPSLSDCTKRTTKEVQNVQPSMDETYNHESTKRTTIKKNNKNKEIKTNNDLKIVNKESIIDFCNSLYTKYSIGRWSKQQWNTLIDNFVNETNWKDVNYPKAYIIDVIETIAYKHDFKYGKVEKEMNENSRIFLDLLEQ